MQEFEYGNLRIRSRDGLVYEIASVGDGRGRLYGEVVQTGTSPVQQPRDEAAFSAVNARHNYSLLPQEWRPQYVNLDRESQRDGTLVWRGDTRPPESIFREGFLPRIRYLTAPVWRCALSDMHPLTTVCLSTTAESGALFPLINAGEQDRRNQDFTWLYGIVLRQASPYVHTQWIQHKVAAGALHSGGGARPVAEANARAGELCVQRVEGHEIVGAVRVERHWHSCDWTDLGRWKIRPETFEENQGSQAPAMREMQALVFRRFQWNDMTRDAGEMASAIVAPE